MRECRFLAPVFPGDTLSARSEVIGLRQASSGDTGIVYVRTTGSNQRGAAVLEYVRWVMVRKRDHASPAPETVVPALADRVDPATLATAVPPLPQRLEQPPPPVALGFRDYAPGETIDHIDGVTIEEAEHQLATRLYQNTSRVHFNAHAEAASRLGRRLVYGGVIMSIARALSFNGLGNAFHIAAINGGRHAAPVHGRRYHQRDLRNHRVRGDPRPDRHRRRPHAPPRARGAPGRPAPTILRHGAPVVLELDAWLILPVL